MGLSDARVSELYRRMAVKEISAEDVFNSCMTRIEAVEPEVHAFLSIDEDRARERARAIDAKSARGGYPGRIEGIPYAIKDNMVVDGWKTTCGSKILEDYVPVYDATVVERLGAQGAIMLAKANMDEFAFGSSTENSAFGPTRNPWDLERVPGGSSGGSAAAVAAGMVPFAFGSDTGGSIRQPAALCGVVGLKPTYGLVSRYGLVAFGSSLDQIGPFTRSVLDSAIVLETIAGHDPRDSTSIDREVADLLAVFEDGVARMRIGYVKELMGEGLAPEVRLAVQNALHVLEKLGAEVEEVSLPSLAMAVPVYYLVAPAEASSNLARFDGVRYGYRAPDADEIIDMYERTRAGGFGPEAKRRIVLGTYALSAGYYDAYYGQAQKVRTLIAREFAKAFEDFEVLISPTAPTTAFKIGEKADDPLAMYLSDICTIPVNLAGIPAISLPCGVAKGLPVGLQIMGPHLSEPTIFRVAYAFEHEFKFQARPPLVAGAPPDPSTTLPRSTAAQWGEFATMVEHGGLDPAGDGDGDGDGEIRPGLPQGPEPTPGDDPMGGDAA